MNIPATIAATGGGTGADALGTYVVQTSGHAPANAQVLASLATGLLKVTTGTGVLSAATGADVPAIAEGQVTGLVSDLAAKAPLASPALTGTPTAPTAAPGTNTTQVATTAFVLANAGSATAVVVNSVGHAPTGSSNVAAVRVETSTGSGNTLDFGVNSASPFNAWIQTADQSSGYGVTYPLLINPNGGALGVGTSTLTPGAALTVGGTIAATGLSGLVAVVVNSVGHAPTGASNVSAVRLETSTGSGNTLDFGVSPTTPFYGWIQTADQTVNYGANYPLCINPNGGAVTVNTFTATGGAALTVGGHLAVTGGVGFFGAAPPASKPTGDVLTALSGLGLVGSPTLAFADLPVPALTTAADGATVTFDLSVSNLYQVTLGGNRTLALSNDTARPFTLIVNQDGTGSRTVTWFSGIRWPGGTDPTLTTTAGKSDVFTFIKISAGNYLGFQTGAGL